MSERPIERMSLPEQARDRLRRMIVLGRLSPGGNVAESDLSEALGISRTPLREALKLLATEGLVELRSNRGAFIVPLRAHEIADVFDVAATLEGRAAELAARRASPADFQQLRRLQERMEEQHRRQRREPYFELNQAIHRGIVALSGNPTLQATHETLFARMQRARFLVLDERERWDQSMEEHGEILAALEARAARRAATAMARHVRRTGERAARRLAPADSATCPGEVS